MSMKRLKTDEDTVLNDPVLCEEQSQSNKKQKLDKKTLLNDLVSRDDDHPVKRQKLDEKTVLNDPALREGCSEWAAELCYAEYCAQRSPGWFAEKFDRFLSGSVIAEILQLKGFDLIRMEEKGTGKNFFKTLPPDLLGEFNIEKSAEEPQSWQKYAYKIGGLPDYPRIYQILRMLKQSLRYIDTPIEKGPIATSHAWRGTICEVLTTAAVEYVHDITVLETGIVPLDGDPNAGASPDGVATTPLKRCKFDAYADDDDVMPRVLLEYKAPAEMKRDFNDKPGSRYNGYYAQVQWQMLCTDATHTLYVRLNYLQMVLLFAERIPDGEDAIPWFEAKAKEVKAGRFSKAAVGNIIETQVCDRDRQWMREQQPTIDAYRYALLAMRKRFGATPEIAASGKSVYEWYDEHPEVPIPAAVQEAIALRQKYPEVGKSIS